MKALVLEQNARLAFKEVPEPRIQPDECLIDVAYSSVCNSDVLRVFKKGAYRYPLIMGHEFSGRIVEVGAKVKRLKVGDMVAVFPLLPCFACEPCHGKRYAQCTSYDYYGSRRDGGFAERISVKQWNLVKLPKSLPSKSACLIEVTAVAIHAARKLKTMLPKTASHVLILGAGVIGQTIARYLLKKSMKTTFWLLDRNAAKFPKHPDARIKTIVSQASDNAWVRSFAEQTQGGAHVVVEASGASSNYRASIQAARRGGAVLWVGNPHEDATLPAPLISESLRKELHIQGVWNSYYDPANAAKDDWSEAIRFLSSFKETPWVDHCASLSDGPSVFDQLYQQKLGDNASSRGWMKVVFRIGE